MHKQMGNTWYAVTDGNGKFVGRINHQSPLGWGGPAQASCFANEAGALAVVASFGGKVCKAPVWSEATKSYVVPA